MDNKVRYLSRIVFIGRSYEEYMKMALADTLKNIRQNPSQYVAAELPDLPFEDQTFDLTLSAHFLFMYADKLDYDFHLSTIKELMRVTKV